MQKNNKRNSALGVSCVPKGVYSTVKTTSARRRALHTEDENSFFVGESEYYKSGNLSLVATLCCLGAKVEAVDRSNGPWAVFCVRRERGLDQIVQAFYAREIKVDPLDYFNALKQCKTRLYDR